MTQTKTYTCPVRGLSYEDIDLARKCEDWCKAHNSCNLENTKHSINKRKL